MACVIGQEGCVTILFILGARETMQNIYASFSCVFPSRLVGQSVINISSILILSYASKKLLSKVLSRVLLL